MANGLSFPTILVAEDDQRCGGSLVRDLEHQGYFVLVASDGPEAIEIARVHSRPIHLLLTGESINGRTLAAMLKRYRPEMRALFITRHANHEAPDLVRSETAVEKVRQLLQPPGNPVADLPLLGKANSSGGVA
jgi:CheY-like chemotaxis protein